ncbi:MAG: hypothetical protein ACREYE_17860 [Gammaproteobacteria bacterium]
MKSAITLGVALTAGLLGALGAAPQALAGRYTNTSGTICKNYNAGEATLIDYFTNGTRSLKSGETAVICPLSRNTKRTLGAIVYVDIQHSSSATTDCNAYSYNFNGDLLGSADGSFTGTGFQEIVIDLSGAGKSAAFSDYSVLCYIPGDSVGRVLGVDLEEQ